MLVDPDEGGESDDRPTRRPSIPIALVTPSTVSMVSSSRPKRLSFSPLFGPIRYVQRVSGSTAARPSIAPPPVMGEGEEGVEHQQQQHHQEGDKQSQ